MLTIIFKQENTKPVITGMNAQ